MRLFALALVGFGCLITLNGCSSPFLPHNAVKYIPEFSHAETMENVYPSTVEELLKNGTSSEKITEMLTEKFGLTEEEAQLLLEQALEENSL